MSNSGTAYSIDSAGYHQVMMNTDSNLAAARTGKTGLLGAMQELEGLAVDQRLVTALHGVRTEIIENLAESSVAQADKVRAEGGETLNSYTAGDEGMKAAAEAMPREGKL